MDIEKLKKRLVILYIVIIVLMLVITAQHGIPVLMSRDYQEIKGTVTDEAERVVVVKCIPTHQHQMWYEYEANGQTYAGSTGWIDSSGPGTGNTTTVLYDEDNPEKSISVMERNQDISYTMPFALIAAALTLAGIVMKIKE